MKKTNLKLRTGIILCLTLLGVYKVVMPPMTGAKSRLPHRRDLTWTGIKQNLQDNISLGLDLKGGSHLVMRVKTEEFLKRLTEENAVAAQNAAKEAGFEVKDARADVSGGNYRVVLQITDPSKAPEIKDAVEKKIELGDRA